MRRVNRNCELQFVNSPNVHSACICCPQPGRRLGAIQKSCSSVSKAIVSRNSSLSLVVIALMAAFISLVVSAALARGLGRPGGALALPLPLGFGLVGHSRYMCPVFLQLKHLPSAWSRFLSSSERRLVLAASSCMGSYGRGSMSLWGFPDFLPLLASCTRSWRRPLRLLAIPSECCRA